MLIILPPSEGKTAPSHGPALDLSALYAADRLTDARRTVMDELAGLSAGPQAEAVLGLGTRSAAQARLNLSLATAPCAPALALYTGVLYDAAELTSACEDPATASYVASTVLITSGLWGLVRATDYLPDHRLSMGVRLPGAGNLARFWRSHLADVMEAAVQPEASGLVVDCRSGAYSPAWQPTLAQARAGLRTVRVRVESLAPDGTRSVVSHHAKHARGLLAGALVREGATTPGARGEADLDALVACAGRLSAVADVELGPADRNGRRDLTIVLAPR